MDFQEKLARAKGFIAAEEKLTCTSPGVDKLLQAISQEDTPAGRLALMACEKELVDEMRRGTTIPASVKDLDGFHAYISGLILEGPPEAVTQRMLKMIQGQ